MEGQPVSEHYQLDLQSLRGTDKALWQRELGLTGPKIAAAAGISNEAVENLWYDSIIKLTIHVLRDPTVVFKQKHYMERYLWIGKQTGITHFTDRLGIFSTYLPLFPLVRSTLMSELMDIQKVEIIYDTLPHYYIKR
jgi:hypothetical protein